MQTKIKALVDAMTRELQEVRLGALLWNWSRDILEGAGATSSIYSSSLDEKEKI